MIIICYTACLGIWGKMLNKMDFNIDDLLKDVNVSTPTPDQAVGNASSTNLSPEEAAGSVSSTNPTQENLAASVKSVKVTQPRTFHQLGIFLLDGSGSMSEKSSAKGNALKALEVDKAMFDLFGRFKVSRVDQNFSFSVMKFANNPTVIVEPKRFKYEDFVNNNLSYNTRKGLEHDTRTGGTEIYNALEKAKKMANDFLADVDTVPQSVLILVLSDGECFDSNRTKRVAEEIKSNPLIKIAAVYLANIGSVDREAKELMEDIASDNMCSTVYDGDSLRAFFERSITSTSGVKIGVEH